MPIFAYSDVALAHITDILHDLYFSLHRLDFVPNNGVVSITIFDRDRILRKGVVSEFRCSVYNVTKCELEGDPKEAPDPVFFNEFKYDLKRGQLVLKACDPVRMRFLVNDLHVELEQLV